VSKHLLKEVKASGGCHGIGKEFFVLAQSRFRTQLCQGIIDKDIILLSIIYRLYGSSAKRGVDFRSGRALCS